MDQDSYFSGLLVDAWYVDTRNELDSWGVIRIVRPAMDLDTVYPVLMDALVSVGQLACRSDNRKETENEHGVGQEWCRSNCSSSYPRHPQDRKSTPLK